MEYKQFRGFMALIILGSFVMLGVAMSLSVYPSMMDEKKNGLSEETKAGLTDAGEELYQKGLSADPERILIACVFVGLMMGSIPGGILAVVSVFVLDRLFLTSEEHVEEGEH